MSVRKCVAFLLLWSSHALLPITPKPSTPPPEPLASMVSQGGADDSVQLATTARQRRQKQMGLTVAASAALGSFLHGYDTGVIAGALLFLVPEFGLQERPGIKGLVVSATTVGAVLGTIAAGPLAEKAGQKRAMLLGSQIFLLGGLLLAWSPTLKMLVLGRFVVGLAMGTAGAVVPVYIAESVDRESRGQLATVPQLFVTSGIFASYIVDLAIILATQGSWRLMLGISVVPAILQTLALLRLPESPRWLLRKGRKDDALQALKQLRGLSPSTELPNNDPVMQEFASFSTSISHKNTSKSEAIRREQSWSVLLRPRIRRVVLICMCLQMFQQITGINTIIYYTPEILREAGAIQLFHRLGLSHDAASMGATLLAYLPKPFAVLVASAVMDSVGRRGLLLRCLPLMGICLALLSASLSMLPSGTLLRALVAVASVGLFGIAFSISLGPIPSILSSEILPSEARALGMSVSSGTQWLFNALMVAAFPILAYHFGTQKLIAFFAAMCGVGYVFVQRFVPETAGKSLEEASAISKEK